MTEFRHFHGARFEGVLWSPGFGAMGWAAPDRPSAQHDLGIDARGVEGGFAPDQNRVTK